MLVPTGFSIKGWITLAMLGALVLVIYIPGLHGGFLFDDYGNLPALGESGPIVHWATFWRYITSGYADPTGRPLTMLTFLLDARDWPALPYPFKRDNLILHLFNGLLLAQLLLQLGRMAVRDGDPKRIEAAAILGTAFWLLHPLFVSTTLYIVQREAMLPVSFILLGLLLWLRGREMLQRNRNLAGVLWMTLGLGGCTLLGVLSKANGILLPALALVLEYVLLRTTTNPPPQSRTYRHTMLLLAWLPTAIIASYLLDQGFNGLVHGISVLRPWTLGQRLLTEPRVLMDYLGLLWLPRPFTPGLFNDQVQVSTSLLSPITTLPALFAVAGLIAAAWHWRRQHPALAAAVLFYFVGQSLESSTVALELYFEHRNYLPALLMFWPIALWLCGAQQSSMPSNNSIRSPSNWSKAKTVLAVLLVLGLALMTQARSTLWGNTRDQALLWAKLNPDSPRAQANAAQLEMSAGYPKLAIARLAPLLANSPDQAQLALNLLAAECQLGHADTAALAAANTSLATMRDPGSLLTSWFTRVIEQAPHPACPELNTANIAAMLDAVGSNPFLKGNAGRQQDLYYLKGRLALVQGKAGAALDDFNHALDLQVRPALALEQAALLGSAGFPREGLTHLDHYDAVALQVSVPAFGMPRLHAWILRHQRYWPKELARLRATLRSDAALQTSDTP
ncbi:MAG: hypothetical protein RSP_22660 [Rhodanobacter sp.]